ncbi:MAG: M16 family metallopeptidase [Mariprofundaceae bacterium]
MKTPFTEETQIPGGPLVISHAMPEAQSVALGIFVDTGSRDEREAQAGISHALEHMLFKGTKRLDVHALSEQLDQLGGNANAFTSRERTCFHMHVLHEDWPAALGLLGEMLLDPALPADEWQRERMVIFSEMGMVEDTPDEWAFEQHMQAMFPNQSVGRPTLGTQGALSALSHQDMGDYLAANYRPPRLLMAAAGRIIHTELVDALAGVAWPQAQAREKREAARMTADIQYLPRELEQAQLLLSYPGITAASDERPVAWLANQVLGGGMSSCLFREVREKRGLAYHVGSHLLSMTDTGVLTISCSTEPAHLPECIDVIRDTLLTFAGQVAVQAVERGKRQLEVQLRMGMDSVEGQMLYLGGRLDESRLKAQDEWIEQIRQVTPDEMQQWIRHKLSSKPIWSLCAPAAVLQSVQKIM